jgi:hypothetical protein
MAGVRTAMAVTAASPAVELAGVGSGHLHQ